MCGEGPGRTTKKRGRDGHTHTVTPQRNAFVWVRRISYKDAPTAPLPLFPFRSSLSLTHNPPLTRTVHQVRRRERGGGGWGREPINFQSLSDLSTPLPAFQPVLPHPPPEVSATYPPDPMPLI